MKTHYMVRKSKEFITLKCGDTCFNKKGNNYFDEDMSRQEKLCMVNCYHKTFRYLVYANTAYTYFTSDPDVIKDYMGEGEDKFEEAQRQGVGVNENLKDKDGNTVVIPTREEMQALSE